MIHLGNNIEILKTFEDASIDSIVTDPPYGLSFMGKKWDYDVPSVELWRECLRVLKPGGHVLSFGGTRTYHRMVVNMEDAGFEIRDQLQWIYGSGFPKSLNVSKAIDKEAGVEREVTGFEPKLVNPRAMTPNGEGKRECEPGIKRDNPATESAKQWDGWGTALKPANEPICLARKPISESTVAKNVVKWGTGAINVDECRIEAADQNVLDAAVKRMTGNQVTNANAKNFLEGQSEIKPISAQGRWPANVLFDEDAAAMLDEQVSNSQGALRRMTRHGDSGPASRFFYVAKASSRERNQGIDSSDLFWESEVWESADLKSLMENISQLARDTSDELSMADKSWSTDLYGHSISEQYPKGMMFTIETVLKLIIELKTLSCSPNLNTKESIRDAIKTIEKNGLNLAESVAFINQLELNTTRGETASLLGVVRAALPMLQKIKSYAKQGNFHSTVKPIKLMEYLVTLITPPGGKVLDPFMGSGTTGIACKNKGLEFEGIELQQEYFEIAKKRIS